MIYPDHEGGCSSWTAPRHQKCGRTPFTAIISTGGAVGVLDRAVAPGDLLPDGLLELPPRQRQQRRDPLWGYVVLPHEGPARTLGQAEAEVAFALFEPHELRHIGGRDTQGLTGRVRHQRKRDGVGHRSGPIQVPPNSFDRHGLGLPWAVTIR